MVSREQDATAVPDPGGTGAVPRSKQLAGRAPHRPKPRFRQFYIFLIAADVVVLFIYFFLVPKDAWENYDARLRSVGSLLVSVIAYLGLNSILQRYVTKAIILDQTWFRAIVFLITPILWLAILPVWSIHLKITPAQVEQPEVQIVSQSSDRGVAAISRYCELSNPGKPAPDEPSSPVASQAQPDSNSKKPALPGETICAFGQLLLRPYEIKVKGAANSTYLPAPSIFINTFVRHPFTVQLPCRLEVFPVYPNEKIYARRQGEKEADPVILPDDGVIWLMPGRYEYIRATDGKRNGKKALDMPCRADFSQEIPFE